MKDVLIFNNCYLSLLFLDLPSECNDFSPLQKANTHIKNQHSYNTRGAKNNTFIKTLTNSKAYSRNSVRHRAAPEWNETTTTINTIDQNNDIARIKFAKSLKGHILNSYN